MVAALMWQFGVTRTPVWWPVALGYAALLAPFLANRLQPDAERAIVFAHISSYAVMMLGMLLMFGGMPNQKRP